MSEHQGANRSGRRERRRRVRDLPLLWKLLIPSLVLTLLLGTVGAYALVRYVHRGAQSGLDQRLYTRSVDADVLVRDETVALLESLRVAANLEGVGDALAARNRNQATTLLLGVTAIRDRIDLLVGTDRNGAGLVELRRPATDGGIASTTGGAWRTGFVAAVLDGVVDREGDKRAGLLDDHGTTYLAVAAPVHSGTAGATVAGSVIVAERLDRVVHDVAARLDADVSVFTRSGVRLAASAHPLPAPRALPDARRHRTRRVRVSGGEREVLDSELRIRDQPAGILATSIDVGPAFATVRGAEERIVLVVVLAMVGVVLLALFMTRFVTRQMRPLLETNRALGRGDLGARAMVLGGDELGEVAAGLNQMAEQLQASYAELELRVSTRTEELQRVYDQLAEVLRARTEVFAAISHEFRSPLFAILGHADLMADPNFRPAKRHWRRDFAATLRQSAELVLGRVNELLDIARVESTAIELDRADIAIGDVIADLRGTLEALARRGDLDLRVDVAPALPTVWADAGRVREVVLNLVSNAVKYTPPGGSVTVTARSGGGQVCVGVSDTGVGIPPAAGERVFEPFYRVHGVSAHGGEASTGLGLAMVQRLVRAHGGDVDYKSELGRGSEFVFTLPATGTMNENSDAADNGSAIESHRQPTGGDSQDDSGDADHEHGGLQTGSPRSPAPAEDLVA